LVDRATIAREELKMERHQPIGRIIVGLDGSEGSGHGLQWAIEMAKQVDAEIVAVHIEAMRAYLPAPMGILPPGGTPEQWAELQQTFADEWCAPIRKAGVQYRTILEEGQPAASALIQVALREGGDIIVLGSRGLNGITEMLLGSVSHNVAHHSPIPVVIVPPAVREKNRASVGEFSQNKQPALLPVF